MSGTHVSREAARPSAAPRRRTDYVPVRSFILAVGAPATQVEALAARGAAPHRTAGEPGRWHLRFVPESPADDAGPDGAGSVTLVLGDDAEGHEDGQRGSLGNAAVLRIDVQRRTMEVWSSITGLPPVFLCRRPGGIVVTSDLTLLPASRLFLGLDPVAVGDLFHLGYPTDQRTLFAGTSLVPGGHVVRIDGEGRAGVVKAWSLPETPPCDWPTYLELQAQSFRDAMQRMDLSETFFSLTAGVDTRTILAALVSQGWPLPSATLCGPALSLDARAARALSRAYGFSHQAVHLGEDFLRNLPAYVTQAARLSGGVSGVEEAGEVYFYRQVGRLGARRLAGGFGNQVARQGLERVSPRGADRTVLAREFASAATRERAPAAPEWRTRCERLLQEDGTLPSVGNAAIGQHFATQQTPYASRALIEVLGCSPLGLEPMESLSRSGARRRDLRHRFLGEPKSRSFQRAFIAQVGGRVASYPINWGWRPSGGVSARGLVLGALACLDQVASWPNAASRGVRAALRLVGAEGLQEIKPYRAWITDWLKDFVHDTLRSRDVRESGVFDARELTRVLEEHYSLGQDRTGTIVSALDLAIAHRAFCVDRGDVPLEI